MARLSRALGGGVLTGAEMGANFDCLDACITERNCQELSDQLCAPASEVTDYERCLGACADLSNEDIEDLAESVDFSERCPDGAGGEGGAGGSKP